MCGEFCIRLMNTWQKLASNVFDSLQDDTLNSLPDRTKERSFLDNFETESVEVLARKGKEIMKHQQAVMRIASHLALVVGSPLQIFAENSQGNSLRQQSAIVSSIAWNADS